MIPVCIVKPGAFARSSRHPARRGVTLATAALAIAAVFMAPGSMAQKPTPEETLKSATDTANKIREATGSKPAAQAVPAGNPCDLLTTADVQKAFPGAKAGERSARLEQYGITECAWKGPQGQVVLALQESVSEGTVKEDAMGMAQGFVDPMRSQAIDNVRIEPFSGMGYPAMGFVEKADPKRGILGEGAMLAMRSGKRTITIGSSELAQRDRGAALKALDALGQAAAKRLR